MAIALESRALSMKAFDDDYSLYNYSRGNYLILVPSNFNAGIPLLSNSTVGGDFITFKKTQGYDVDIQSVPQGMTAQQIKDTIIMPYYENNPMLEYVLLVGDVTGAYIIETFTIASYNEEDIDVTDYPYTFTDNQYEPHFFIGRWTIQNTNDFIALKSRSINYVTLAGTTDGNGNTNTEYLNNALLVAGNYKTAEGAEVLPSQWPVTPVWTSIWLQEEMQNFGYAEVDTAFFSAYTYNEGIDNAPAISSSWDDGVGVVNYRGWGDANGWHKPYFHKEEALELNNGWKLPIVMSFVCNTGDFGNDYSGNGLDKCFGESLVTAGTYVQPKGAAAMVGPSDLDTDTRFNNVICGTMWDAMFDGRAIELAPALHAGKQQLTYEFSGLTAPDGTVIDAFYHHVYGVIGDPSIPVWLKDPGDINIAFSDESPSSDLNQSFVSVALTDDATGEVLSGVVGALLDSNGDLIGKSVSNSNGVLTVDFDTNATSSLTLYFNAPQYKQSQISLNYISDDGSNSSALIPLDLDIDLFWAYEYAYYNGVEYIPSDYSQTIFFDFSVYNSSDQNLTLDFEFSSSSEFIGEATCTESFYSWSDGPCQTISDCAPNQYCTIYTMVLTSTPGASPGDMIPFTFSIISDQYEVQDYIFELPVSQNYYSYPTSLPSIENQYGYKAYDHTDVDFDEVPVYDWVEINQIGTNLNLTDDSVINDVQIGFDFNYFGNTYNSLTISSNGWASFEPCQLAHFWNFSIPHPMGPSAMLAPFMDDLDDNNGTEPFNVFAYNDGNGQFIVQWDDVSNGEDDESCPDCIKETFQMILKDPAMYPTSTGDGEIIYQYKEIHDIDGNGNYSTIGIESPDQEDGVQYLFSSNPEVGSFWQPNSEGYYENIAIKFTTGNDISIDGDVNYDGILNVVDLIAVINIILGDADSTSSADVNNDGIININDIVQIVNWILAN